MSIEQEILRVEREYWQLGDPGALAKRLAAFEQSLAASWMNPAPAAPTTTHPISGTTCGSAAQFGNTIPLNDTKFGTTTLTWDGVSTWTACHAGISRGGVFTFALHYVFNLSGQLFASWKGDASANPVASVCSDATNWNNLQYGTNGFVCSPFKMIFAPNGSAAMNTLYQQSGGLPIQSVTIGP